MTKPRYIDVDGERLSLQQLAERAGVSHGTIRARLNAGCVGADLLRPVWADVELPDGTVVQVHSKRGLTKFTIVGDEATADVGGRTVRVDAADVPLLSKFHWGLYEHGRKRYTHAYVRTLDGRRMCIRMPRLLLNVLNESPRWVLVDHINGDGLDNRRANLRLATPQENARNRRLLDSNRSGVTGVNFDKRTRSWTVSGATGDHLGIRDFREAVALHWRLVAEEHGEFAYRYEVTEHTCPLCRRSDVAEGDDVCAHCRAMINVDCTSPAEDPRRAYKQARRERLKAAGLCTVCGRRPIDRAHSECRCAECVDRRSGKSHVEDDQPRPRVTLPTGREVCVARRAGTEFTVCGQVAFTPAASALEQIVADAADVPMLSRLSWRASRRDGRLVAHTSVYDPAGGRLSICAQTLVCAHLPAAVDGLILPVNGNFLDVRRANLVICVPDGVVYAATGEHLSGVSWGPRTNAWYVDGRRMRSCAEALVVRWALMHGHLTGLDEDCAHTLYLNRRHALRGTSTRTRSTVVVHHFAAVGPAYAATKGPGTEFTVAGDEAHAVLQHGERLTVDAADVSRLADHHWFTSHGYVYTAVLEDTGRLVNVRLDQLLLDAHGLPGVRVDHVNGDPLDCRRANIRLATTAQNLRSGAPRATRSGVPGVAWDACTGTWTVTCGDVREAGVHGFLNAVARRRQLEGLEHGVYAHHPAVDVDVCPVCRQRPVDADRGQMCAHCWAQVALDEAGAAAAEQARADRSARAAERRRRRIAAGLCAGCGACPPVEGTALCAACAERNRRNAAAFRERRRARGAGGE